MADSVQRQTVTRSAFWLLNGEMDMTPQATTTRRFRRVAAAGLAVFALVIAVPASAAPVVKRWDRSDNSVHFEYDAARGDIVLATSGTRFRPGDAVTFLALVEERNGAPAGRRLRGVLTLRLNGDHALVYRGWFGLRVLNSAGDLVLRRTKWRRIVLQPRRGERRAQIGFVFDLPSGAYDAVGRFRRG